MTTRFHPLSLVTAASIALPFIMSTQIPGTFKISHLLAVALVVAPLFILLWAHLRVARTLGQNAWLASCAIPLALVTYLSFFLMVWMQLGLVGALTIGVLLSALAFVCIAPMRRRAKRTE